MASFIQGKNRKWSVRFRFVEFGKVKQKRLSGFATKKDADKAYADFIATHKSYKKSDYSNMIFNELYNYYIRHIAQKTKVSTQYDIENNFRKHIQPYFGEMKIFKITKHDIISWQNILNEKKYSFKFKSKLRTYLKAFLQHAVYYYDLPANPVNQVETFKKTESKKEMIVWALEDFSKFISTFDNEKEFIYKVLFSFLYLTGCRKGEAFALTWNDIDFNNRQVSITKNLTRKVNGIPYMIVSTKTGENRILGLPDNLMFLLYKLKKDNANFVFGGERPLAENTVTRVFYRHIEQANVPKIHIHGLRHSHASLLISNGESIVMVAKRLGHASVEQTLNTYAHLMPNDERKMLKALEINI